jgi:uncharacterized protein (TIRG00374 family)
MKKKDFIFFILTCVALAAVAFYVAKNAPAFKKIVTINPWDAIPFVLLQIALIAANASVLLLYLSIFGLKISFFDSFGLNALNTFFNNIFVKGGPVIKGYYLKRIHNLSYTDFVLTVASFALMEVMVGGLLAIFALVSIYIKTGCLNYYLLLFFISLLAVCCAVIILPLHNMFKNRESRLIKKLFDVAVSWRKIAADKALMSRLFIMAFLNFAIFALRLQYGFKILYGNTAFVDCLLISAVGTIGNMFAVTPGGLGIREFLVGAAYKLINGDMLHAIVVTVLDRVVSTMTIFLLGVFFILYFLNKTKKGFFDAQYSR